ncbi:MAG: DUF5665 domain-containing protein [Bacillota bacterium]
MTERTARLVIEKLEQLSADLENASLAEYVEMLKRPRRMLVVNLLAGMARGLGMAVGFTLLGALLLFILTRTFVANLPLIGNLIAELVLIVEQNLRGPIGPP